MIKLNLYGYNDAWVHVKGVLTIPNTGPAVAPNNRKQM